jgi:D-3-phosphoglycerate dehydrogenase
VIVNTARAELIRPGALEEALRKGRPGYAAVDVYEKEPVTGGNHPLLKMPNALCVPHLGWTEWDNFELYFRECFEQIVLMKKVEPSPRQSGRAYVLDMFGFDSAIRGRRARIVNDR